MPCTMASVPAREDKANWCGEQARWIGEAKCWAMLRDTTLRRMSPMTIPRTRPFGFCNATMRPELLRNLDKCVCAAFVIQ